MITSTNNGDATPNNTDGSTRMNAPKPCPEMARLGLRVEGVCCRSIEQAERGILELPIEPTPPNGITLNENFGTADIAEGDFKPVYNALLAKRNGDDALYNSLNTAGKELADAVEDVEPLCQAMRLHRNIFAEMVKKLTADARMNPSRYDKPLNVNILTNALLEVKELPLSVPDFNLKVLDAMPPSLIERILPGAALEASGLHYTGDWLPDEQLISHEMAWYSTSVVPAHDSIFHRIRDAKEAYLSQLAANADSK